MDNKKLIDILLVTNRFKDVDMSEIEEDIEIIKSSKVNLSNIMTFILDSDFDKTNKEMLIGILGMIITNIKDEDECKRCMESLKRHLKSWYEHLEGLTFEGLLVNLEYYLDNYEEYHYQNGNLIDYLDYLSIIDTLETETFKIDGEIISVCQIQAGKDGQQRFALGKYFKVSTLYSMICIQGNVVKKFKEVMTLEEKKNIILGLKQEGFELIILTTATIEEEEMLIRIVREGKLS